MGQIKKTARLTQMNGKSRDTDAGNKLLEALSHSFNWSLTSINSSIFQQLIN